MEIGILSVIIIFLVMRLRADRNNFRIKTLKFQTRIMNVEEALDKALVRHQKLIKALREVQDKKEPVVKTTIEDLPNGEMRIRKLFTIDEVVGKQVRFVNNKRAEVKGAIVTPFETRLFFHPVEYRVSGFPQAQMNEEGTKLSDIEEILN